MILRPDEKNPNEVKPEVYMISDQGQALERSDLFIESSTRRKMQVRVKEKYIFYDQGPPMHFPPLFVEAKM